MKAALFYTIGGTVCGLMGIGLMALYGPVPGVWIILGLALGQFVLAVLVAS